MVAKYRVLFANYHRYFARTYAYFVLVPFNLLNGAVRQMTKRYCYQNYRLFYWWYQALPVVLPDVLQSLQYNQEWAFCSMQEISNQSWGAWPV